MSRSSSHRQCPKYEKNVIFFSLSTLFVFSFNYILFFSISLRYESPFTYRWLSLVNFLLVLFFQSLLAATFFFVCIVRVSTWQKAKLFRNFFCCICLEYNFLLHKKNMKLHNASFISRIRLELANTKLNFFECFQVNLNLLEADWIRLCWGHSLIVRHNFSLHLLLTHFFTFYILLSFNCFKQKQKNWKKNLFLK